MQTIMEGVMKIVLQRFKEDKIRGGGVPYVDDAVYGFYKHADALRAAEIIRQTYAACSLTINEEKSTTTPSKSIEFNGLYFEGSKVEHIPKRVVALVATMASFPSNPLASQFKTIIGTVGYMS
jgi:hypothetical protein